MRRSWLSRVQRMPAGPFDVRLVAIDETAEKARAVANEGRMDDRRICRSQHGSTAGTPGDFGGKDPVDFYLED